MRALPHTLLTHPTRRGPLLLPHLAHQLLRYVFGVHFYVPASIFRRSAATFSKRTSLPVFACEISIPTMLTCASSSAISFAALLAALALQPACPAQSARLGRRRQATGRFNRRYMR